MLPRPPKRPVPIPIHSRLEPDNYERLAALADQQNSSVARIVKLAVIEFLDRHERGDCEPQTDPIGQTNKARTHGEQWPRRDNFPKDECRGSRK